MSDLARDLMQITNILKRAKCETIDRKKCFVLSWGEFLLIYSLNKEFEGEFDADERLASMGYNNFSINISAADEGKYYVVSKAAKMLDEIWIEPPQKA